MDDFGVMKSDIMNFQSSLLKLSVQQKFLFFQVLLSVSFPCSLQIKNAKQRSFGCELGVLVGGRPTQHL